MRILIIGGTGFIGPWVVRNLVKEGHSVAVFHRGQTTADLPAAVLNIPGERQKLGEYAAEFRRFGPDVVLDMFPYTEEDARLVVQIFRGMARRAVAVSSMDVYRAYARLNRLEDGAPDPEPFAEDAPLRSVLYPYRKLAKDPAELAYSYDKIPVEQVFMSERDLPGTILRLPAVYGPGDRQHRLFEYVKRMMDGRDVILLEEKRSQWRWTRAYVENVGRAIARAVADERSRGRIYNVGPREAFTEREWVERIGRAAEWKGIVKVIPAAMLPQHLASPDDWRHHLAADTSRIRNELSYEDTIGVDEALRRTVVWERAHPPQVDSARFDYSAEDAAYAKA
jgi:nucleoside-diphosphate-sugar epimerase